MVIDEVTGIGETVRVLLENPDKRSSGKGRPTSRHIRISECALYNIRRMVARGSSKEAYTQSEHSPSPSEETGRVAHPSEIFSSVKLPSNYFG